MLREVEQMSLGELYSNFYELASATQNSHSQPPKFTVLGNSLYSLNTLAGRLVVMWNRLLNALSLQVVDDFEVNHILIRMEEAAKFHFKQAHEDYLRYRQYQDKRYEDATVSENAMAATRENITNFNLAFQLFRVPTFRKMILERFAEAHDKASSSSKKIMTARKLVKKVLSSLPAAGTSDSIAGHLDASFVSQMAKCQQMLDLEGLTNSPIPHALIKKVSIGDNLDDDEERQLKKWVGRLNSSRWFLTSRKLHHALLGVVERLNHEDWKNKLLHEASLSHLEYKLMKSGCKIFEQSDSLHLLWRRHLEVTKEIFCNGKKYKLDQKIGQKGPNSKHDLLYSIAGDKSKMVTISFNEADLGIRQQAAMMEGSLIPTAKILEVDSLGKCALVERLYEPLDAVKWSSSSLRLSRRDAIKASAIAESLATLLQNELVPDHFSLKHLMFNREGQLKSSKPVRSAKVFQFRGKNIFNFNALVTCAEQSADENPFVLAHILRTSGLSDHAYADFYRFILEHAFNGLRIDVGTEGALKGIFDPRVIDRAADLMKEALALREDCCQDVLNQYRLHLTMDQLKKNVGDQIISQYKLMSSVGTVSHLSKKEIIAKSIKR